MNILNCNFFTRINLFAFFFLIILSSCSNGKKAGKEAYPKPAQINQTNTVKELRDLLKNPNNDTILVIAHRGDWRNSPENSIPAIKNAIEMGVDIVEIDLQRTKDGELVLMHDKTIDRTTNGKGQVSDFTLDSIKTFYLKNGLGRTTYERIPTLKEAMEVSKNKVLVNLDKSYEVFDEVIPILKETNTLDHVIVKGKVPLKQVKDEFGEYLDKVIFMPIVDLDESDAKVIIDEYVKEFNPVAIEFVFETEESPIIDEFDKIREKGSRIWVNSLWASLNAGYEDELAIKNTDSIYGWYIKKRVNMIQTDRPELLLEYLRDKKLHK